MRLLKRLKVSLMDKNGIILAARYAKAWLHLYPQALIIEDILKLNTLSQVLAYHAQSLQEGAVAKLVAEFSCADQLQKLVDLLVVDRRLFLLPSVLRALAEYALRVKNIQYMTLESSHEISKADRERVADWAAQQLHAEIIYNYKINPELIMGVSLFSDTYAWECSARKVLASYALLIPSGVRYGN